MAIHTELFIVNTINAPINALKSIVSTLFAVSIREVYYYNGC